MLGSAHMVAARLQPVVLVCCALPVEQRLQVIWTQAHNLVPVAPYAVDRRCCRLALMHPCQSPPPNCYSGGDHQTLGFRQAHARGPPCDHQQNKHESSQLPWIGDLMRCVVLGSGEEKRTMGGYSACVCEREREVDALEAINDSRKRGVVWL